VRKLRAGSFGYNSWAACLTDDPMIVVVLTNGGFEGSIFDLGRPLVVAARSD
jgi:hypothetical protein